MRTCELEGCDRKHESRGFCKRHYERWKRHGDPAALVINYYSHQRCSLPGCDDPIHARGYCRSHYDAYARGTVKDRWAEGGIDSDECMADDCTEEPMGRGRWCYDHFIAYVNEQDRLRPGRRSLKNAEHGTGAARERHRKKGEPYCPTCVGSVNDWLTAATKEPAA